MCNKRAAGKFIIFQNNTILLVIWRYMYTRPSKKLKMLPSAHSWGLVNSNICLEKLKLPPNIFHILDLCSYLWPELLLIHFCKSKASQTKIFSMQRSNYKILSTCFLSLGIQKELPIFLEILSMQSAIHPLKILPTKGKLVGK